MDQFDGDIENSDIDGFFINFDRNFMIIHSKIDEKSIKNKIKDRENARKKGDYKLADHIRKDLEKSGVIIEDKGDKTTWRYK